MRDLTLDDARSALQHISPDGGHDERAKLAMALYAEFGPDAEGVWSDWAAGRSRPDLVEDRDTWRSARHVTKLTIGTLIHLAQRAGWVMPKDDEASPPPDPARLQAEREEREAKRRRAEDEYRQRADQAARDARALWADADARDAVTPYLARKGVGAYGTRALADGTLLVPMRNADGELQNVQRIWARKPADGVDKRYLPSARKSGLLHLLGGTPVDVLLLGEGYATCASLHMATGLPVAVCFDAGNLKTVALAMHERYPQAVQLVCADNDAQTEAETGKNPGAAAARAAVRAVVAAGGRASMVLPEQLPPGGTDFNDAHLSAGLEAVDQVVRHALAEALAVASEVDAAAAEDGALPATEGPALSLTDATTGTAAAATDLPPWADVLAGQAEDADAASSPLPPSPGMGAHLQVVVDNTVGATAPTAPTEGEGGGTARDQKGKPERKRPDGFWELVDGLTARFALIYGSDTAWDGREQMIVRVAAMRLAFGKDPVNMWLARPSRRMVLPTDLVFEPGCEVGDGQINMFAGLDLEPVPCTPEEVAPMLALLRHLCSATSTAADDVDAVMHWILRWQALPLQQLGAKMQTAVVFHGAQGTGKNLYWDVWRDLFGTYGITVGQTELEDKFNGWLSRKLAIIGDEVVSRQEMYHNKNRLKLIVTQGAKFPIRGMMQETRWESNHANVVFLSNESVPLALEERDRRFLVIYTPLEADPALYEAVRDFKASGGLGKWLWYLQNYVLDGFTEHTRPIMTRAKEDLIEMGWRPPERFAHEWLEGLLDLPVRPCSAEQLYRVFRRWADLNGERWPPAQAIFTRQIDRWVRERVQRDLDGKLGPPRLIYKQVGLLVDGGGRRTARCWLPAGTGPRNGETEGEWATKAVAEFEHDLFRYTRRAGSGSDDGGGE